MLSIGGLGSHDLGEIHRQVIGCDNPQPFAYTDQFGTQHAFFRRCNKCDDCRAFRKKQWTGRILAENMLWNESAFVTLTYDDDHVPPDLQTGYKDVQKWIKRLRQNAKRKIPETHTYFDQTKLSVTLPECFRYYAAGELGPLNDRPHWHLILFGMPATPRAPLAKKAAILRSSTWTAGFVTWEPVSVSNMAYAACYSVKKTDDHLSYMRTSLRPGLGATYYRRLGVRAYLRGKLPHDIRSLKVSRSYWPIDSYSRKNLNLSWLSTASAHSDRESISTFYQMEHSWKRRAATESRLIKLLEHPLVTPIRKEMTPSAHAIDQLREKHVLDEMEYLAS